MELKLLNEQGQDGANVAAADEVFGREYNEALIHQVVVAYAANGLAFYVGSGMAKDGGAG